MKATDPIKTGRVSKPSFVYFQRGYHVMGRPYQDLRSKAEEPDVVQDSPEHEAVAANPELTPTPYYESPTSRSHSEEEDAEAEVDRVLATP